ncbi:MAG: hypothetical protein LBU04_04360 [Christensenellaceae bacterium]|jgi:segregation and condensation protein A|nr:hypothetical protein [Christensenellaceae bacterium]
MPHDLENEQQSTAEYQIDDLLEDTELALSEEDEEGALPDVSDTLAFNYHYYNETIPFDFLYKACREGKVDILEVHLTEITAKVMKYISEIPTKDFNIIARLAVLVVTLIEYKVRKMLPSQEDEVTFAELDEEFSEISARKAQESNLLFFEEYKMFKDVSDSLGEMEILNRFYREPLYTPKDYRPVIKNPNVEKLVDVFEDMLENIEYYEEIEENQVIIKERFTVSDMLVRIISIVREKKEVSLFELYSPDFSRVEIINTFLAVLEVLKRHVAESIQIYRGGDLLLRHTPETDNVDLNNLGEISAEGIEQITLGEATNAN